MSEVESMYGVVERLEDLARHVSAVENQINEQKGHAEGLLHEADEVISTHLAVYDAPSQTGDSTKGVLAAAKGKVEDAIGLLAETEDALDGQAAALHQAAEDVRQHAERIVAAGGS